MFGPVMAGERVRLEPPRSEYAPAYLRWFADRDVTRYLKVRNPTSLKKQDEWLEQMAASEDDVLWAIVRATDGGLIGNLGLHKILWRHQRAERSATSSASGINGARDLPRRPWRSRRRTPSSSWRSRRCGRR